jgi:hypothetical protein
MEEEAVFWSLTKKEDRELDWVWMRVDPALP